MNVEVEQYSNLLIGFAILYTFVNIQMPGRCRLPSTVNLTVFIMFVYGVFLNFASFHMTNSLERRTDKLHYGLPSFQEEDPRYRKPNIKKIGSPTQPQHHGTSHHSTERHILSLAEMADMNHGDEPPGKHILPTLNMHHEDDSPRKHVDTHHFLQSPHRNVDMDHELPGLNDKIRQEWYDVIQTNPMYKTIPKAPLRVALITRDLKSGPTNHVLIDGLLHSKHLKLVGTCLILKKGGCELSATDIDVDLWLIDANGIKTKAHPGDLVHQLLDIPNPHFQILFVDYSDRLVPRKGFMKNHYPDLPYSKLQQNHIRFGLRGIVRYDFDMYGCFWSMAASEHSTHPIICFVFKFLGDESFAAEKQTIYTRANF